MPAKKFLQNLQTMGNVEYEMVRLSEYNIGTCRGCRICFDKGEEFCPHKDDRDKLIEKMKDSDGVIFASPNYSFQVSGLMKVFLDRLGLVFIALISSGKHFQASSSRGSGRERAS